MANESNYNIQGVKLQLAMQLINNSVAQVMSIYSQPDSSSELLLDVLPGKTIGTIAYFGGDTGWAGSVNPAGWIGLYSAAIEGATSTWTEFLNVIKLQQYTALGWIQVDKLPAMNMTADYISAQAGMITQAQKDNPSVAKSIESAATAVGTTAGNVVKGVVSGIGGEVFLYLGLAALAYKAFTTKSVSKKGGITFK